MGGFRFSPLMLGVCYHLAFITGTNSFGGEVEPDIPLITPTTSTDDAGCNEIISRGTGVDLSKILGGKTKILAGAKGGKK